LEILREVRPELVLLDMRMPVMNGWTFARALDNSGDKVSIMVMTAATDARRWAKEINADGYVGNPFDIDELLTTVERATTPMIMRPMRESYG
jgi:two-component system, chemotaxis family, chemotaxis protein CheY